MPRISEEPVIRIQIRLFKSDYNKICALDTASGNSVGASRIIREIVRSFIRQSDSRIRARIDSMSREAEIQQ